jgi:hypothetical protein
MCLDLGLSGIIGLVGTAVSAAGSIVAGQQQAAMAEAQAKAYEQQAQADAQASAYEAQRERKKQELLQANARAQVGASGAGLAGSPSEVLAANAREGELDLATIRYGSQLRQNNLRTQAGISRFSGRQARTAGYINAGTGFISGLSNLYDPNKAVKFGKSAFSNDPWGGLR